MTPQPSTKHLTDEELKQQYGIHLTSRLQADAESKEAKWADIDDDEDDWAPETIEWNDGTKTTLAASELAPTGGQLPSAEILPLSAVQVEAVRARPPQFASSVGPNATVLKLGASAERQLAQKAATEKAKSPLDKTASMLTKSAPAPSPAKSPWASLPPVDKVSPIAINPQPMGPPQQRFGSYSGYSQSPSNVTAPSPAKEISADDFNRSWKDSPTNQPRELFMPSSGRYEAVPEGRRRMSKNDQNFRAPAVLQRPSQSDMHAPAEPSAAFQTMRSSADVGRRRASSIISGGSGQFARRLSIKSGDVPPPVFSPQEAVRPISRDGPPSQTQTPSTYQARGPSVDYMSAGVPPLDIEAERERQKVAMKERVEAARQRKLEEEARLEAEKKERIAKRLAALPPLPTKDEEVAKKAEDEVTAKLEASHALEKEVTSGSAKPAPMATALSQSPPKPPQPLATGEPQQYGLMKVHALDAVKKMGPSGLPIPDQQRHTGGPRPDTKSTEELAKEGAQLMMPLANGLKAPESQRPVTVDSLAPPEPSPKFSKPASAGPDSRGGWGDIRDHRSPPSGNLWGISSNKALGNGTFDQGLAGYAPQDLSRTSSTAQGWISGRTPMGGRSPQPQYATHHAQDPRANLHPPLISPDQTPLAADSEADPLFPTVRPAPIAPPQAQQTRAQLNGMGSAPHANGNVAAWNNFHHVAGHQERAENERYQRELAAKREEELRTGVRQGPPYTFNETWKQVHLGDQANQRHLSNVHQSSIPGNSGFGAVGTMGSTDVSPRLVNGQPARGSRFFPAQANGYPDRRAVTYSHPEIPRSPSPPPAEEYASYHPAFDGDYYHPMVKLPREKPVVKLPSTESEAASIEPETMHTASLQQPMTWAAKAAMPVPMPSPSLRSASTPIVQNPSWQERFNGLLGKKSSQKGTSPIAPSAVASFTREPLDVIQPLMYAAVSMPHQLGVGVEEGEVGEMAAKEVEDEVDLFEDRDMASLPAITLPMANLLPLPLASVPRKVSNAVEPSTVPYLMLTTNPTTREPRPQDRPQFALIRMPESSRSVKKDLPIRSAVGPLGIQKNRNVSGGHAGKRFRGGKSRQASKAH